MRAARAWVAVLAVLLPGCSVTFGGDDSPPPSPPAPLLRTRARVAQRLVLTGGITANVPVEDVMFSGETCARAGLEPFEYDPFALKTSQPLVTVGVRVPGAPATGDVVARADQVHLYLQRGFDRWQPRGPVRLRRGPGNRVGEMVIDGWRNDAVFDAPARPPVSGRLTWTCTEETV